MRAVLSAWIFVIWFGQLLAKQGPEVLFFSLGSNCEIANALSLCCIRHAAGPLDWVLTLDYDRFLLLLKNDFEFFLDRRFLIQYPDTHVINTLYNIDFRHDWPDLDFEKHFPEVECRLQRRADRILSLKQYEGKVVFVRGAFDVNVNPHLPSITKECVKITLDDAQKINEVLRCKYPNLDFILVIVNYDDEAGCEFSSNLHSIIEFKVSKSDRQKRHEDYQAMIECLLELFAPACT